MTSKGLECPVCCESFDDQDLCPRMLRCGHSFCSDCLERLSNDNTICCPTCRDEVNVPQAGVAGLPKNFALLSIINVTPQHEGGEGLPICEVCDNKHPANSYCLDCEEDMCKDAARFHTRNKTSRDHKVVSLELSAVSVYCLKHDEPFRLFDVGRGCMICRSCIISFRDRNVVSLAQASSECKEKMEALATKASSRAKVIEDAEARVMDASLEVKKSCEEQRTLIESVFKELRTAITTREQILVNELEQLQNSKAFILTEQQGHLHKCQESIASAVQDVLSTIQSLDNANLLAASSELESTLVAMEKQPLMLEPEAQCVPEVTFDRQRLHYVQDASKKLGTVSDKSTCAETTTAAGSGLERAKPGEVVSFVITARDAQRHRHTVGGDTFTVQLQNELGEEIRAIVRDEGNGSYLATYTIPAGAKRVDYTLSVRLRGAHIQGSPFTVHLAPPLRRKTNKKSWSNYVASKLTHH